MRKIRYAVLAAAAALILASCGDAGDDAEVDEGDVEVVENPEFEDGTRMAELAEAGTVTIGVKFDQPGIGFKAAGDDTPQGFDPEVGKIIAGQLGIAPDQIKWVETISDNREPFLQQGTVDFVIASYSITDERREVVGQAGPYYVTGQQLLVASDSDIKGPEDIKGKKVCSVTGSTSIQNVERDFGADPAGFDTYSECVDQLRNGSVDAVTTDGAILLGYAAQEDGAMKVVGEPFSEERYGIGFSKDAPELCGFINDALTHASDTGALGDAFDATLGGEGVETPALPPLDPCQ